MTITNENLEMFIANTYALYTRALVAAKDGKDRGYWYGFIITAITRYKVEMSVTEYSECFDFEKMAKWAKTEFENVVHGK